MARVRIAVLLVSAAVIGAGLLGGWRVSVRFVGTAPVRGTDNPPTVAKPRPVAVVDGHALPVVPAVPSSSSPHLAMTGSAPAGVGAKIGVVLRSSGVPVSPGAPVATSHAAADSSTSALAPSPPKRPTSLHLTFQREWRPVTYEIGSSTTRPPVRLLCQACPAVNWATNRSQDQPSTDQEKLMVNAASVGAIAVVGGRITLMEWDP